ncbi:flavodoxin domain-containing protein [Marinobacter salicampi]|uniref:flavodoxin domain-containing protein n=1 Tax=Marinobacter salicampi TaxID=435907 RepID=UPI00140CD2A5|nr:flavodoxin domain-containing protein [Marinobacter salicampi]
MTAVTVLVGSVYGGALQTARELSKQFRAQGHCIRVVEEPELEDLTANRDPVLICTSTTGQGEVPPGLLPLYLGLRDQMPMQEGRPFGIIVLGDSSYGDTYCGAGDLMEEALLEVAAVKVGETLRIDALEVTEPETVAILWFEAWLHQLP